MSQAGFTRKRGKSWTAYWSVPGPDGDRRQRSKGGFPRKTDAQAHLTTVLGTIQTGTYNEPAKITLRAFVVDEWLPSMESQVRPSTFAGYREALVGRVLPRLGGYRLAVLTPKLITDMRDELLASGGRHKRTASGLAPKTVRNTLVALTKCLDDAVKLGYLGRNPAEHVAGPRIADTEMQAWTREQAHVFLDAVAGDRLEALWSFFLTTGVRRGEALGLRWSAVDLEAGQVSIVRTIVAVGYDVQWSEPKTKKGRRRVKLDELAVAELRAHRLRQVQERLAAGSAWTDQDLVFCREDGAPLHPQLVSQAFERAVARLPIPDIRLHDCRHTMATLALACGVHVKVVSERLGHANITITLSTYAHVLPDMQDDAAERIGEIFLRRPTAGEGGSGRAALPTGP